MSAGNIQKVLFIFFAQSAPGWLNNKGLRCKSYSVIVLQVLLGEGVFLLIFGYSAIYALCDQNKIKLVYFN